MVYGYNADISPNGDDSKASSDLIHEHAQTLLTALTSERYQEGKSDNGVIWVAHSLGGILVKRISIPRVAAI